MGGKGEKSQYQRHVKEEQKRLEREKEFQPTGRMFKSCQGTNFLKHFWSFLSVQLKGMLRLGCGSGLIASVLPIFHRRIQTINRSTVACSHPAACSYTGSTLVHITRLFLGVRRAEVEGVSEAL